MEMRFFYGLEKIRGGMFEPTYLNTEMLTADMLTKALGKNKLTYFRSMLLSSVDEGGVGNRVDR